MKWDVHLPVSDLHAVLSQELMRDPLAPGRLRQPPVEISGTVFQPSAMPQVIEGCFTLLLNKATAIPDPYEQATEKLRCRKDSPGGDGA